jgi:hypothetical protein
VSEHGQEHMQPVKGAATLLLALCAAFGSSLAHTASTDDLDAVLDQSHKSASNDDFLPP